ncbi:hypothetical protein Bca52824_019044 [Brassica carinata]|uniref:Uncharacterized protein n=1 Tax=Brassica carinata TaxID=52824 RepID=A0A8X8AZ55_BRACI|nr:hypothetical protein Bca52824_019044 [Brassica carinata]
MALTYAWSKIMIMWHAHCWLFLNHYGLPKSKNLESRGSRHHFNHPTLGQLVYYMAVRYKRTKSSLTERLFFSSSKSLDPNRADPSLKLAMEYPKWTEEKTNICMSEC